MKLKNKKTGEMGVINYFDNQSIVIYPIDENWNAKGDKKYVYHSLAELNEEWQDYEEPKDFWYIDDFMIVCGTEGEFTTPDLASFTKKDIEKLKAIGNYFESKEEAEKAVEKLKAWKRLKDKGFRFCSWFYDIENQEIKIKAEFKEFEGVIVGQKRQDLDLLFGGEE
ncbi:MAG: hypothetical protein U0L97_01710 [Candidatus Saccharimonadaceae bacterium]|nr:hypothetical protein [Candidatus Saccharimonadaceae bacterium]